MTDCQNFIWVTKQAIPCLLKALFSSNHCPVTPCVKMCVTSVTEARFPCFPRVWLFLNGTRHWLWGLDLFIIVTITVDYIFACPQGAQHCSLHNVYCPISASQSLDVLFPPSSSLIASNTVRCCQPAQVKAFHTVGIPWRDLMERGCYYF